MNSILLACALTTVALGVISIKDMFKDIPALLMFIMIAIDAMVIYLFWQSGVPKLDISFGIVFSTVLKVLLFILKSKQYE